MRLNFNAFCKHYCRKKSGCFHYYTIPKLQRLYRYLTSRYSVEAMILHISMDRGEDTSEFHTDKATNDIKHYINNKINEIILDEQK